MSEPLMRFVKTHETRSLVTYDISSPDFDANFRWLSIGRLQAHRVKGWHRFKPLGPWSEHQLVPTQIYGYARPLRDALLQTHYRHAMHGRYTSRIYSRVQRMFDDNYFPDETIVST